MFLSFLLHVYFNQPDKYFISEWKGSKQITVLTLFVTFYILPKTILALVSVYNTKNSVGNLKNISIQNSWYFYSYIYLVFTLHIWCVAHEVIFAFPMFEGSMPLPLKYHLFDIARSDQAKQPSKIFLSVLVEQSGSVFMSWVPPIERSKTWLVRWDSS